MISMTASIVMLAIALGSSDFDDDDASRSDDATPPASSDVDCGIRSLFLLLQSQKIDATFDEIKRLLPTQPAVGYSIGELRETSRRLGFPLKAVQMDPRREGIEHPTIIYLNRPNEGHFVFIRPTGVTGRTVQVLEYPFVPKIMDLDYFVSRTGWQGIALVASSKGNQRWVGVFAFSSLFSRLFGRFAPAVQRKKVTVPFLFGAQSGWVRFGHSLVY